MDIEVTALALNKTYEFNLNEELPLRLLAEEVAEAICQYEHCRLEGTASELLFFHVERKRMLNMQQTLLQAEVKTGDRVLLA